MTDAAQHGASAEQSQKTQALRKTQISKSGF